MKIHSDEAMEKFEKWVRLAQGNSYIVYQALTSIKEPTNEYIEKFIKERLQEIEDYIINKKDIKECMDNIPKHTNDTHAMGYWAYTYQEVIWEALKSELER